MRIKKIVLGLVISLGIIAVLISAGGKTTCAQGTAGADSGIMAKLDQVLANQRTILDELAAMREELRIVKIRVTQTQ